MRNAGLILMSLLLAVPTAASSAGDRLAEALPEGGAGSGGAVRAERSPYRGHGMRYDYLPVNLFLGERAYLHSDRIGVKRDLDAARRVDLFLAHRYEGTPLDGTPAVLERMALREQGTDLGLGYRARAPWGTLSAEYLRNVEIGRAHV